jgi:2-methylcitrate dehydratase PrpD
LGVEQLSESALANPHVRSLMAKVTMQVVEGWNDDPARARYSEGAQVTIIMRDGRRLERFTGAARGSTGKPLDDDRLDAKVLHCLQCALSSDVARRLIADVRSIATLRSVAPLFEHLKALKNQN